MDYPDGFSNEWRDYMTYDKATDPDAGLKLDEIRETIFDAEEAFTLDFTSKKREGLHLQLIMSYDMRCNEWLIRLVNLKKE